MSTMDQPTTPTKRRPRRRFTDEFKAEAVRPRELRTVRIEPARRPSGPPVVRAAACDLGQIRSTRMRPAVAMLTGDAMNSDVDWLSSLPGDLLRPAYRYRGEAAWPREAALKVVDQLSRNNCAILGVEIWLPTAGGPTVPSPYIYHWSTGPQGVEPWDDFVRRSPVGAQWYVSEFRWDPRDVAVQGQEPFFNFTVQEQPEQPWK